MTRVLSSDPGTNNFSTAALDIRLVGKKIQFKLLRVTMIQNRVKELNVDDLGRVIDTFDKEYFGLVKMYKPEHIVAERYMVRGMQGGTSCESVSIMLGRISSHSKKCKSTLAFITAAQWKNAFNRNWELDQLYEKAPFVAHAVDAICIGLYRGCQVLGQKPFEFLSNNAAPMTLLKQMGRLHASIIAGK